MLSGSPPDPVFALVSASVSASDYDSAPAVVSVSCSVSDFLHVSLFLFFF